jgi:hypothetical protein
MRYYKQQYPKPNKPVRHEAMMAIKPKHVSLIKYVTRAYDSKVLYVSFGRFFLTCIISGKHANEWLTRVSFKNKRVDGFGESDCNIAVNSKDIRPYSWADSTGPDVGHYMVKDEANTTWSGLSLVKVYLNDCMTPEEYELIRETIAWTWGVIDSGTVSFPIGDYKSVSIKQQAA